MIILIFESEIINSTADGYRSDNINNPASKAWIIIYPTLVNGKALSLTAWKETEKNSCLKDAKDKVQCVHFSSSFKTGVTVT